MHITPDIIALGPTAWIPSMRTLILSDIHLGFEEALRNQGILTPSRQWNELKNILEHVLSKVSPETIILAGDVKHEFGRISKQEWAHAEKIITLLRKHSKKIIAVKGNHDTILEPLAKKLEVDIVKEYSQKSVLVLHGDRLPEGRRRETTIIIGHAHPAITLRTRTRAEKFKCFIVGTWKKKKLIILPSVNPLVEGSDVLESQENTPFLKRPETFQAFIVDGINVRHFGTLRDIQSLEESSDAGA